jgi:hypothetical protein
MQNNLFTGGELDGNINMGDDIEGQQQPHI